MVSKGVTKSGEAHCMSCGAIVDRGSDRCQSCYSDLDSEVKAFNCPRCKRVMELGTPQCTKCGMRFIVKAVKARDPEEDDRLLAKLMDWGKKPDVDAAVTESVQEEPIPEEAAEPEMMSGDGLATIAKVGEQLESFISEREATLSRMRHRIDQVRENISAFTSTTDTGPRVSADDLEGTLSALSKDFTDMASLQRMIHDISSDIDRVISSPEISASLGDRDLAPLMDSIKPPNVSTPDDISSREEQLAKREEMVDRKIKAYAQKMKQLEARESELGERGTGEGISSDAHDDDDRSSEEISSLKNATSALLAAFDIHPEHDDVDAMVSAMGDASERIRSLLSSKEEMQKRLDRVSEDEEELRRLLKVLDNLLGQLPSETIDQFSKSDDFALYERILDRMKI